MHYIRLSAAAAFALGIAVLTVPTAQAAHEAASPPCTQALISAHEGYKANDDGDTVESQQAAFDIGSNIADTDLWVTADGYIVEMHDDDVSHSTDGTGLVTEMTLAQVLALHTKQHHEAIPQLNDSLAIPAAHEPGNYLMVEMKFSFSNPDYLQLLDDEITQAGMANNVIIYTAYLDQAQALKQLDPNLIVWYKADSLPPVGDLAGLNGVMILSGQINAQVVQTYHDAGLTVSRERAATESRLTWQRFVATGADSLMTDDPVTAINACDGLPIVHT